MKKILSIALSLGLFAVLASALGTSIVSADPLASHSGLGQQSAEYVIYVGDGCPHCAKVEEHVEQNDYDEIFDVEFKEVYHDSDNATEFNKVAEAYGIDLLKRGVPAMVVHGQYIVGDTPINDYFDDQYDKLELDGAVDVVDPISGGGDFDPGTSDSSSKLTLPLVIGAALVDAINPCAFAVLIILLTTILAGGMKRRALYAGLLFSLAIFLSYLAMGLGLYGVVATAGISLKFMKFIGVLAILLGLFNLKDVFFYGKGFVMEVPMSWRPKMKAIIRSVTSPFGAFVIGILISLFLLPCTSGPYIVIISLLGQEGMFSYAVRLLVLYNLIFVAPMVFITLAVYKGFSVERAEEMRQKRLKVLHLIAGVILVVMGVVILMGYV
jgi:cytochrome c biogenesis protein CcdA/glutaredoxin